MGGDSLLSGFDHITLVVEKLEDAVRDMTVLLGTAPTYRGHYPDLGTESALFGLHNALVELVAPWREDPRAEALRERVATHGEGLYAMAFETPDAEAASRALREQGLGVSEPRLGEAQGDDGFSRQFLTVDLDPRDSRGVPLWLVERFGGVAGLRAPAAVRPAAAHALDHVVVCSADVEAAKGFYGDKLGLRLALDSEAGGRRMLFFRFAGVTVEIVHDPEAGEHDRLWGAAYRVADLRAAHLRLHAAGVELDDIRTGRKQGTQVFRVHDHTCGMPTLFLHDPARSL